jgi:sugar/nucleoside kinase (ribokinase family)
VKQYDVVGLGLATLDILAQTPRLPNSNDCFPIDALEMQGGGPVATALVALSKLGANCNYLGSLAADETVTQIISELHRYGIETQFCPQRNHGVSSASVILVEQSNGQRAILFQKSTSSDLQPEEVPKDLIRNARALHLDGFFTPAAIHAAQIARENNVLVSFDGGAGEIMWDELTELLPLVDILVVAKKFALDTTGKQNVLEAGVALFNTYHNLQVVITDGEFGSWYWDADIHFHQPAFQVDVVDTTGAGDVFHGAYLYACLQPDWSSQYRLKFASAVAALKCQQVGGRKGIPTLAQTEFFLENYKKSGEVHS